MRQSQAWKISDHRKGSAAAALWSTAVVALKAGVLAADVACACTPSGMANGAALHRTDDKLGVYDLSYMRHAANKLTQFMFGGGCRVHPFVSTMTNLCSHTQTRVSRLAVTHMCDIERHFTD